VHFYIAEGKAKILPYGQTAWDSAFSGTKLLVGDALKTASIGKAVMVFFNGTIIRMGSDTAVTLTNLNKDTELEKIVLAMDNGSIWVNGHKSPGVKNASYEIRTTHMLVKAKGTVFEVENGATEVVRVMDGQVAVDVLINTAGKERVAQTIDIGVGQEVSLDEAALKAFEDNQSPSVLMAINDQFKAGQWYSWNIAEDRNPTSYSTQTTQAETVDGMTSESTASGTEESTQQSSETTMETVAGATQETQNPLEEEFSGVSGVPEILKPDSDGRTVDKGPVTISGTVPEGTQKVVVEQVIDGKTDSYTLGKFKAGDTTWSYNVSDKLGNFKEGDNTYSFYAVDSKGNKSSAAEITITYNKAKVEITDALADPVVLTFNGSSSSTVTADTVKVEGSIKGAEKVVVSDYTLSKFVPGSLTWSYTAKEAGGNLKPGLNEYEVYGIDADGNKSVVVKFTITYNKTVPVTSTTTTVPPPGF